MKMDTLQDIEQINKGLLKLPLNKVKEVLDFVEFLQFKGHKLEMALESRRLDPMADPILKLMGMLNIEPFADDIDRELYGE